MKAFTVTLKDRKKIADKTYLFSFSKPEGFLYKPGQYISLELIKPKETDSEGAMREFSLTSAPYEKTLSIATRIRSTTFKRLVESLPIGEKLTLSGPFGNMTLHSDIYIPAVFLTGGIGVTPFISMIKHVTQINSKQKIYLFLANRNLSDAVFLNELQSITTGNKQITFIPTMTKETNSAWKGERGYVTNQMIKKYIPDILSPFYYIAGKPRLVWYLRETLEKLGIPDKKIRGEEFTGY